MALQLAHKGFDVVITYQTKSELADEVVKEIKASGKNAVALQLDVAVANSFDGCGRFIPLTKFWQTRKSLRFNDILS